MATAEAQGVEQAVAPWTQRVERGRECVLGGVSRISGSPRKWVRVVLHRGRAASAPAGLSGLSVVRDSDDESDDASAREEEKKRSERGVGHRCVAEWLLLLQALASVDPPIVGRALAKLERLKTQLEVAERNYSASELESDVLPGFEIVGEAASLSAVVAHLSFDQDGLSAEFEQARETILGQSIQKTSTRKMVGVRFKVNTPRLEDGGDTTGLDLLASALRQSDRWRKGRISEDATLMEINNLDFHIEENYALQWLADAFPSDTTIGIGQLSCSGDLGTVEQLESAVNKLLHGVEDGSRLPLRIQHLVLHNPLNSDALRVFCRAVQNAKSLHAITVDSVLQEYGREPAARARRWRQFASAVFGLQATHRLHRVTLKEWTLVPEDVLTVVDAVGTDTSEQAFASSNIVALDVSISGVQGGTISPLVELLHALRNRLPRLASLKLAVSDDPAINDAVVLELIERFAPTLRDLSLQNVELDSLAALVSPNSDKRLRLHSLHLHNLFVSDMTSCSQFFEKLLGDPTNPAARHLGSLHIDLSERHSASDVRTILSLVESMLRQNSRILRCVIQSRSSESQNAFQEIHGQPAVEPVRLATRVAFLSIFSTRNVHNTGVFKKLRTEHPSPLPRLHQDGIALVFAYAASHTTRVAVARIGRTTRQLLG